MEWYQWVTFIISILGFLGLGGWFVKHLTQVHEKNKNKKAQTLIETIKEANEPLVEKVDKLAIEISNNKEGVVAGLRTNMMILRDQFRVRGYATQNDKAAYQQLYDDYTKLGGNHLKAYVDRWKNEIEALPEEDPNKKPQAETK